MIIQEVISSVFLPKLAFCITFLHFDHMHLIAVNLELYSRLSQCFP